MNSMREGHLRILRFLSIMAVVGVGAAGCATGGTSGSEGEASEGSTTHPVPNSSETTSPRTDEVPRTDLDAERVVEWTKYEIVSDRQLRLFFPAGDPECYGARAVVEERPSTIHVATIVGTLPDAPANCTMVGRTASILIATEDPVDEREVSHLDPSKAIPEQSPSG